MYTYIITDQVGNVPAHGRGVMSFKCPFLPKPFCEYKRMNIINLRLVKHAVWKP